MGHPRLIRAPRKDDSWASHTPPVAKNATNGHPRLIRAPRKDDSWASHTPPVAKGATNGAPAVDSCTSERDSCASRQPSRRSAEVYTAPVAKNATNGAPAVDSCTSKRGQLGTRPLCPCRALCETWEVEYHSSRRYFKMLSVVEMKATQRGSRRTKVTASQLCR